MLFVLTCCSSVCYIPCGPLLLPLRFWLWPLMDCGKNISLFWAFHFSLKHCVHASP
uniref:Uncharacterized protein n=1 Tax=Rhizophora mucronata TaxID=61149 RepID=A0A2P2Q6P1_RHIMU